MVMQSINFFSASGFKWIDPKEFDLNKCIINNHHGAKISVIWLEEWSTIKLLVLVRY